VDHRWLAGRMGHVFLEVSWPGTIQLSNLKRYWIIARPVDLEIAIVSERL